MTSPATSSGKGMGRAQNRWWIYQCERFPILGHAPLIAAFSLSAVCYSALMRAAHRPPHWQSCLVAFLSSFFFFLQLRIADEFKDFEEDSTYRPYRPVPRGLVTLHDLGWVWAGCIAIQLALALWLSPRLIILLAITWLYLALMSKEFFARRWLKARPVTYMVTHMLIMPLIDLYTTACDWIPSGYIRPPRGLLWFLLVSFFNGMVVEIGRKIRSPQDEEKGVETYSFLWGRRGAVTVWLAMMVMTGACAYLAAGSISFALPVLIIMSTLFLAAVGVGSFFLRNSVTGRGKYLELMSGVWSLFLYLSLGVIPTVVRYRA